MKCEKCDEQLTYAEQWRLLSKRSGGYKFFHFCSLDCLSRWAEAQRPIAVAEER